MPAALTSARAVRRALLAGALLAAGAAPAVGTPAPARPADVHACTAAGCALAAPTPAESAAIAADADRLLARYAGDSTPLGRECHAIGAAMRARAAEVRMLPFMWRAADPDGHLAPVTGDAHVVEPAAGAGRVHIARGFDALNPDRGLPAIVRTARHEFAHLNAHRLGARPQEGWEFDAGEQVAAACAPRPGEPAPAAGLADSR